MSKRQQGLLDSHSFEGIAMTLKLPEPVAGYFKADESNGEAVARCFTGDAVVKDEGHTYRGRQAIQKWKEDASTKYVYTCEPLKSEQREDQCVVTCRLTGNFPGSPVALKYVFEFEGEQIASLEIAP
ncbi:hypothetical protein Mal15_56430 [Stieleria maiorica]|uniref:SnoaL-like domain-containing protein n=2 Tax=Stieleria maiorica TaxID=2795974 RepID=A0A5B9MPG4_9BACT|nr:hypothetical protein Mal15_56430 [Stieleria maiorica]